MTNAKDQNTAAPSAPAETTPEQQSIKGQSAFHVELSPVGVVVRTVFVGENDSLHAAPAAVFANLEIALQQLDEMKRLVIRHFSEAAFVGLQVLQQSPQSAPQAGAQVEAGEPAKEGASA